ncbi:PKD domain-containing protein [Algoriphagus aestuarii]|nr:PKD domain-containing protein [Algoriphagus aestuarii]
MKKLFLGALVAVSLLGFSTSCSEEDKDNIECAIESGKVDLFHDVDSSNPKTINLELRYSGNHTVLDILWNYGDGITETVSGKETSHTYAEAGNYKVTATFIIQEDSNNFCEFELDENVTAAD